MPDGMRDRLKAAAAENNRSLNAEIVARLEKSLDGDVASIVPLKAMEDIVQQAIQRHFDENPFYEQMIRQEKKP
jgi:hypothetical protein